MLNPVWVPEGTKVLQSVSRITGIPVADLRSPSRQQEIVRARQIACWVMHHATDYSYPMIARTVGKKDHSTAIHAVKVIDVWRERDAGVRNISNEALYEMTEDCHVCA